MSTTTTGTVEVHTAGELHMQTNAPAIGKRVTLTINLCDLLADPAHTLPAELVERDGLDSRVEDFVFATPGAMDLFYDVEKLIEGQLARGKDVVVLVLCRGGRHRSVAFGDNLAQIFAVTATHHHREPPVVKTA